MPLQHMLYRCKPECAATHTQLLAQSRAAQASHLHNPAAQCTAPAKLLHHAIPHSTQPQASPVCCELQNDRARRCGVPT